MCIRDRWWPDGEAPGVLRNRWLERRHMMHHTRRWERDHSGELQAAWMNGAGVLVWENVFGAWNGWSARDRALLRAMLPVQRHFSAAFGGEGWAPLVPTLAERVYASLWTFPGGRLWTLVNRADEPYEGPLLALDGGGSLHDALSGEPARVDGPVVSGRLEGRGVGSLVELGAGADRAHRRFLARQRRERVAWTSDTSFPQLAARALRPPGPAPAASLPPGMLAVPPYSRPMTAVFRRRECGSYDDAPFVDDWKPLPPRLHSPVEETRQVALAAFAIDAREVSNREYHAFLAASGYRPRVPDGFLAHWTDGHPPEGEEDEPVTFIDLDDARAYAAWAGKRLPSEWEWQHAMTLHPQPDGGRRVWNWTESERSDGRSRYCILKNGSDHNSSGSEWYADGGPRGPEFSAKLLLGWPRLNRRATVGFRCAVSLARESSWTRDHAARNDR